MPHLPSLVPPPIPQKREGHQRIGREDKIRGEREKGQAQ